MDPSNAADGSGMTWIYFVFLTIISWGLYGIFLHSGQVAMGDPINGRYKAFLFVGIAYFLTAIVAPLIVLFVNGAEWNFTSGGMWWSLIAGIVGAVGAFGVLLAFGAKGTPAVVMSLIFAGAPVVNAVVSLSMHPPAGGFGALRWQFIVGILLAALGGYMVVAYKPAPGPAKTQQATVQTSQQQ